MDLSGGTKLVPFGDFETRISVDMVRYLRESGYSNWRYIGATQWFNHVERQEQTEYKFQLTPQLYAPAYPFRLEDIASEEDANYQELMIFEQLPHEKVYLEDKQIILEVV